MKKIFFTLILLLVPSVVFAETIDSSTIPLYHTVGIETEGQNYEIADLMNVSPLSRKTNVGSYFEGLPGDRFYISYFAKNYGDESIFVDKIFLPMSTETSDLTQVLKIDSFLEKEINTLWGNIDLYRSTKGLEYDVNIDIAGGEQGKYVLDEFEVGDSLIIKSVDLTPDYENSKIYVTAVVENTARELLNNVVFEHLDYSYTQNILPLDEVIYQYSFDVDFEEEEIFLDQIKISDPNSKTQCANIPVKWYQYFYPKAISVYSYILDSWISGLYFQTNNGNALCVSRLAHEIISDEIIFKKESVDNSVEKPEESSVLGTQDQVYNGITELPKTSKKDSYLLLTLLVVEIYLWYSVFNKRRKYESKNYNSRICPRSRK
jgi:hypothetical protein